jgi:hypothetical protein
MKHLLFVSYLIILHALPMYAQEHDLVKTEGITSQLHRDNIGKIFFSAKDIATSALQEADFLDTYTLTNKSNLYFIAYMGNSITNYLHRLAPTLSADSLVKIGNYQFTLFVDEKLIYQSNLFPGAPRANIQDTATVVNKPFIDYVKDYGLWSESFWNRFMRFGGDSVLTEGKHSLKMEIRPYLKTADIKVGELIAAGTLNLIVQRKPVINISNINLSPLKPYNGFPISKEPFDKNKIKELKGNIDEGVFKKISSIVVIKHGKIICINHSRYRYT